MGGMGVFQDRPMMFPSFLPSITINKTKNNSVRNTLGSIYGTNASGAEQMS